MENFGIFMEKLLPEVQFYLSWIGAVVFPLTSLFVLKRGWKAEDPWDLFQLKLAVKAGIAGCIYMCVPSIMAGWIGIPTFFDTSRPFFGIHFLDAFIAQAIITGLVAFFAIPKINELNERLKIQRDLELGKLLKGLKN